MARWARVLSLTALAWAAACGNINVATVDFGSEVQQQDVQQAKCESNSDCDMDCRAGTCQADGSCSYTILPGQCLVEGVCYKDGQLKPNELCQVCDSQATPVTFVNVKCEAGEACETSSGQCIGTSAPDTDVTEPDTPVSDAEQDGVEEVDVSPGPDAEPDSVADVAGDVVTDPGPSDADIGANPDVAPECVTAATCPSPASACEVATCDAGSCGVAMTLEGTSCDDGDPCTDGDACSATGNCSGGFKCDDDLPCSTDTCNAGVCANELSNCDCLQDSDCNDSNLCTAETCVANACQYTFTAAPCDDGKLCTENDTCSGGVCGGQPKDCDDSTPCTVDGCNMLNGDCTNDNTGCECSSSAECGDGNSCTLDECNGLLTCTHTPVPGSCDDGSLCTTGDVCGGGVCAGSPVADGTTCQACQVDTFCQAGICEQPNFPTGWSRIYGTSASESLDDAVVLANEDILFCGSQATSTADDYWIGLTDSEGNLKWDSTFDAGGDVDKGLACAAASDGGYAMVGWTWSLGLSAQAWLVKVDSAGNLAWTKSFGGAAADEGRALIGLSDGFAIGGYTSSEGAGSGDIWLIRTDANGNQLWDQTYGTGGWDGANSLIQLPSGGFALAGRSNGDMVLLVTNASGGQQLMQTYDAGGTTDEANAVAYIPADGGFVLVGFSNVTDNADMYMVRTDASGGLVDSRILGTDPATQERANDVVLYPGGGFLVGGYTYGMGAFKQKGWMMRLDGGFATIWDQVEQIASGQEIHRVFVKPDGSTLMANRSTFFPGGGLADAWLKRDPIRCDDGNNCTSDSCDPVDGCVYTNVPGCL